MKELKPTEIPRQTMPTQSADKRRHNFHEVPYGLTVEQALQESHRCLQCKHAPCIEGCPVHINIPAFIKKIKEKDFTGAYDTILDDNAFPSICGRVCPQEDQCEIVCVMAKKHEPVAIGNLERFVGDYARAHDYKPNTDITHERPEKIAVIGAGPAGLSCAGDLRRMGYQVTLFEGLHTPGGVLMYGIPEFRLPVDIILKEIDTIRNLGVTLETNHVIGRIATIDDLFNQGYAALFIGVGAGHPRFLNIPGENLNYIYSANEYLTRVNLMGAFKKDAHTPIVVGKKVIVIGGGNTAMDSARTALRLGAEKVYIVYRRSEAELPARAAEYRHAQEEGINFHFLYHPAEFYRNEKTNPCAVGGVRLQKMKLGEPDSDGRRQPIPIDEYINIECDVVIIAIGTLANPIIGRTTPGLTLTDKGYIAIDEHMATSRAGVFAGGDITSGSATVIAAMGAGRKAAQSIHAYLNKNQ